MREYNFFEDLKESLEQAVAYKNGDKSMARSTVYRIPEYKAGDVRRVRSDLNMSQRGFAFVLGVSPRTVEAWEVGRNEPCGAARNLLYLIERDNSLINQLVTRQ